MHPHPRVEDQPPPVSHRITLFQVAKDGRLRVLGAGRCEARSLSAVEKLQPEHIPIELHRGLHLLTRKVTAEIFSTIVAMPAVFPWLNQSTYQSSASESHS